MIFVAVAAIAGVALLLYVVGQNQTVAPLGGFGGSTSTAGSTVVAIGGAAAGLGGAIADAAT